MFPPKKPTPFHKKKLSYEPLGQSLGDRLWLLAQTLWERWRKSGLFYSISLHLTLFFLLWIGIPALPQRMVEVPMVCVEFAPVGDITQSPHKKRRAPSQKTSSVKKPKPLLPEEAAAPLPPKAAPAQEPPKLDPAPLPPPEAKKPEEVKKEEAPPLKKETPAEKEEKSAEKKETPKEPPSAVIDKSKNKTAKSEEDPQKKKKKKADFAKVLAAISKMEGSDDAIEEHEEINGEKSAPLENLGSTLSVSEEDAIRQQIQQRWIVPSGAKDAHKIIVEICISTNPDGTVRDARIVDQGQMKDPFFRAMAESAQRAVLTASPLKLPSHKYAQWRQFNMRFNPRDMY